MIDPILTPTTTAPTKHRAKHPTAPNDPRVIFKAAPARVAIADLFIDEGLLVQQTIDRLASAILAHGLHRVIVVDRADQVVIGSETIAALRMIEGSDTVAFGHLCPNGLVQVQRHDLIVGKDEGVAHFVQSMHRRISPERETAIRSLASDLLAAGLRHQRGPQPKGSVKLIDQIALLTGAQIGRVRKLLPPAAKSERPLRRLPTTAMLDLWSRLDPAERENVVAVIVNAEPGMVKAALAKQAEETQPVAQPVQAMAIEEMSIS